MPNAKTHIECGVLTGVIAGAYYARERPWLEMLVEVLGAGIGGRVGGILPDVLEPATSPFHRQVAHAAFPVGRAAWKAVPLIPAWQAWFRQEAAAASARAGASADRLTQLLHELIRLLYLLASGTVTGFIAGYLSHVVLDGRTPMSIPFIGVGV